MIFSKILFAVLSLASVQIAWTEDPDAAGGVSSALSAAKACYDGFVNNIPPSFCWKKGADFGTIPTTCSAGFFRNLALCYRHCNPGYNFVGGVCWASCREGFKDHGATCYKNLFDWHWKHSYVSESYTNFDARVECESGKYKSGAVCYRDCRKIGLINCGIGACSYSQAQCAATIITMGVDVAISIATAINTVVSTVTFFSSGPIATPALEAAKVAAKEALKQGIVQAGKAAIQAGVNAAKNAILKQGIEIFIKRMVEYAVKALATKVVDQVTGTIVSGVITTVCDNIGRTMLGKMNENSELTIDLQNFDPTGIYSIVTNCQAGTLNTEALKIDCAKSVLKSVSIVDPTGIIGLATTFMHPHCNGV